MEIIYVLYICKCVWHNQSGMERRRDQLNTQRNGDRNNADLPLLSTRQPSYTETPNESTSHETFGSM